MTLAILAIGGCEAIGVLVGAVLGAKVALVVGTWWMTRREL